MAKPRRVRRTRHGSLPRDILIWEILVRLPPKHLLRCRAVCRAWRRVISMRNFLLMHHGRQPSLPILRGFHALPSYKSILAFDHREARGHQLQLVAQLDGSFNLEASCDGLLLLSYCRAGTCFTVCNPTTGQHAPVHLPSGSSLWGMYQHRPTSDHRILLHRHQSEGQAGCYVCTLGSDQPTARTKNVVNIWVLHDYEGEVWEHEYSVKLPVAEIRGRLGSSDDIWNIGVMSVDGDVVLLVSRGGLMLYVDIDGELVDNLRHDGQHLYDCGLQLKQSLVQHTFFLALEGYAVNSLPFVLFD
ncbi:unnamed protein product [Alopecurus aequalis]